MSTSPRIESLDLLRGIAVLGILIMNIQSFTMPGTAYINPMSYGSMDGANKWVWIISHTLADTKFMSLFSILFGAGIVLLTNKLIATDRPVNKIWYSRLFWLFVFGALHVVLFWSGDILMMYSICGFFAFFFRNRASKTIFIWACILFVIPLIIQNFQGMSWNFMPDEVKTEILNEWRPSDDVMSEKVIMINDASFGELAGYRIEDYMGLFIFVFVLGGFWRILSMMLLGMYFYKKGIITAALEIAQYKKYIFICLPLALAFIITGIYFNFKNDWQLPASMFNLTSFNYIGSLFMAITYLSLVMIWSKSDWFSSAQSLLQKAGRMAFTNYIMTSAICFGVVYAFDLFGKVSRVGQVGFTLGVWSFLLVFTHFWSKYFKMGPLEWLWRSLTYFKWAGIR